MGSDFHLGGYHQSRSSGMALGVLSSLACGDSFTSIGTFRCTTAAKLQWTTASLTAAVSPEQASVPLQPAPIERPSGSPFRRRQGSASRSLSCMSSAPGETEDD